MAPHSSTLAWKIPWTEEPGRLPSMESHRVGHDWSELAAAAAIYSFFLPPSLSPFLHQWTLSVVGLISLLYSRVSFLLLFHELLPLFYFPVSSRVFVTYLLGALDLFPSVLNFSLKTFFFFFGIFSLSQTISSFWIFKNKLKYNLHTVKCTDFKCSDL